MGSRARRRTRIAAIIGAGAVLGACGGVSGSPAAEPAKPFSPAQIRQIEVQDALRAADPCGLLDEGALASGGDVLQFGSAVQPSVCSALVRGADGADTSVDVSLLPSMLSEAALSNPVEMNGVTVYRGAGPDLERGTCERVFPLNMGEASEPHYATVRTGGTAGSDTCALADAVLANAVDRMEAGLPGRVDGAPWAVDTARADPCRVLESFPAGRQIVDGNSPPTPFECTFYPDGVESRGNEVSVALGVKAVKDGEKDESNEPVEVSDRCRSAVPVGREIDVTRPGADVGEFARSLGHARAVLTVHGRNCDMVGKVADVARSTFG